MKKMKRIIALALMALSLMAVAVPAMAVNYTIQAPAGLSGSLIVRKTGSKSGASLGNIGSLSRVDISDPTVNNDGYVAVTILSVTNGGNNQFVMGTNSNKGYILATWVSGFSGSNPGTNPTTPPSGSWSNYYSNVNIDYGDQGTYVRRIQEDINTFRRVNTIFSILSSAYYFAPLNVDGDFGAATLNAVKLIQQRYGLTVDGIVGPATKDLLWQYR